MQLRITMHTRIAVLIRIRFSSISSTKSKSLIRLTVIGIKKHSNAQLKLGRTCKMQLIARKAIHNLQKENG